MMRRFSDVQVQNQNKFKYIFGLVSSVAPSTPIIFRECLSNIFVLETQGVALDAVVKNPGDYKTVFGITEPFMTQVFNEMSRNTNNDLIGTIAKKTKSGNSYDPSKLSFSDAVNLTYVGVWKKMNLDNILEAPDTVRALFDMGFNMGDKTTIKIFQNLLNKKGAESAEKINSQMMSSNSIEFTEIIRKFINFPKKRFFMPEKNRVKFIPIAVDGIFSAGGEGAELFKFLIQNSFDSDHEIALALTNGRVNYYNKRTSPRFLNGLKNRARVFYEYLAPKNPQNTQLLKSQNNWRKNNPGFARYQVVS